MDGLDVVGIIMCVAIGITAIGFIWEILWVPLWGPGMNPPKSIEAYRENLWAPTKPITAYKEYSTTEYIAAGWFDSSLIDECEGCGRDDAPIVWISPDHGGKCKWCMELSNISYHLKQHGVRRLRKEKA